MSANRDVPHPAHVASRPPGPGALSDSMGRANGARARAGGRHGQCRRRSQRDRRAWRLVCALSRAGRLVRRAQPDRTAGPHQYRAGDRDRTVPAMVGARPHRLARSVGPSRRGGFPPGDRRGRRYPPDHRDHQGAAHHVRAERGRREGPAQGRRQDHEAIPARSRSPRRRSSRSGICPASRSASALPRIRCAARCSSRPAACTRNW